MLYHLGLELSQTIGAFNVFRYITLRAGGALLTALLISFIFGPRLIAWLKSRQSYGQPIRKDGPEGHLLTKTGTPTMGGVLILAASVGSTLLWTNLTNPYVWIVLCVILGFGAVGAADDYLKLTRRSSDGLSAKSRICLQGVISIAVTLWLVGVNNTDLATSLTFPIFKNAVFDLGWFFIPFAFLVIVGSSNAVNLTDGLDGLAIVPVMIAAGVFGLIAYLVGNAVFADYLQVHPVPGSGELAIICAALVGASLGFLWYNAPPAMVFMGDTGSLSMGGALGVMSVITKHEIVLAITGGLFVLEALSVIIQVTSFKLTGRRVFLMAPIHHHFEKKGWAEPTIVIRFWILAAILAMVGLSTLKLR
ncbi:MAG: phospho-N-acetylmuramoyl-pentapeptide-transferase [bacterium]|nr:phospho-N-acetylmuramoyl-pentapeptide-transferase [bacterium]